MNPQELTQTFSDQYLQLMDESHNAKLDNPAMSYISISTMTIVCDLSGEIDIKKLSEGFESPSFPVCQIKHTKQHNEYEISKRGKVRKSFYNQITVFYTDHSTKSIKVFSNGRLQMTGLSSIQEASKVAEMMCKIIKCAPGALRSNPDHFGLVSLSIGMINSNFSFHCCIDIIKVYDIIKSTPNIHVTYDPDVYPGLKIKVQLSPGTFASMFVFSTGNVVITGVKEPSHIQRAFVIISEAVNQNLEIVKSRFLHAPIKSKPKKHTQAVVCVHGYPSHIFDRCIL